MLENFLSWTVQARNWNSCTFLKEKPLKKLKLYFLVHHVPVAQQGPQTKGLLNIYLLNLATAQFQDSNTQHFSNEFPGLGKWRDYLSLKLTQGCKGTEILPFCRRRSAVTCTTLSCSPGCLVKGGSTTGQTKVKAGKIDGKLIWLSRNVWAFFKQENLSYINITIKLKLSSSWSSPDFLLVASVRKHQHWQLDGCPREHGTDWERQNLCSAPDPAKNLPCLLAGI